MTPAADGARLAFSTRGVPERERLTHWREFAQQVVRIRIEPLVDLPFACDATLHHLPGLRSIFWASSAARFERTREIIAEGGDTFGFVINCGGTVTVSQRNRELSLAADDAALILHSEPAALTQLASRGFSLVLPRTALEPVVPHVEDAATRVIPRQSEALQLLRGYLRSLRRTDLRGQPEVSEVVARHLADLAGLALTTQEAVVGESSLGAVAAARLKEALGCIADNFQDPALTVVVVASRQGVSPRYLQRLLETTGMSFTEHVNELRLQKAFALLTDAPARKLRITDVAMAAGFSDLSHFNRLFRSRFGDTPRSIRVR